MYYWHSSLLLLNTYSSSIRSGRRRDNKTKTVTKIARMTYTKLPPKTLYSLEKANNEVVIAGAIARAIAARLKVSPLVEPSDCLLGAALVVNMVITPESQDKFRHWRESCSNSL